MQRLLSVWRVRSLRRTGRLRLRLMHDGNKRWSFMQRRDLSLRRRPDLQFRDRRGHVRVRSARMHDRNERRGCVQRRELSVRRRTDLQLLHRFGHVFQRRQ